MRIIPVIDLLNGLVVHAVAGDRANYQPLRSPLCPDPSPSAVAAVFAERLQLSDLYVADLNAIGCRNNIQWPHIASLRKHGVHLWLDAGIVSVEHAQSVCRQLDAGRSDRATIVVALETFADVNALPDLVRHIGAHRLVFSLDMKAGHPLSGHDWPADPFAIAECAVAAGLFRMIVLDLAAVGRHEGPCCAALCRDLLSRWPHLELITGGGIRHLEDLRELQQIGCYAALVATALHDGRIVVDGWRAPNGH